MRTNEQINLQSLKLKDVLFVCILHFGAGRLIAFLGLSFSRAQYYTAVHALAFFSFVYFIKQLARLFYAYFLSSVHILVGQFQHQYDNL